MTIQRYVKDLSKLTGVSVQTLHHYDRIGLLNPSVRLTNGHRLYSEMDLLKLQQIIALKFFGFELAQINKLLANNADLYEHFLAQSMILEKKSKTLFEVSQTLKSIINECNHNKSIPWEIIIRLIEIYNTIQKLEKTWAGKVLTTEELKQYARFKIELKTRFTPDEKKALKETLINLINNIESNLDKDPNSEFGIHIAKNYTDLHNKLYDKEHSNLKHSIWENGFKKGKVDGDHFLKPEIVVWLDKAIDAYFQECIYKFLEQIKPNTSLELSLQWDLFMEKLFGNAKNLQQNVINTILNGNRISSTAKKWLEQLYK